MTDYEVIDTHAQKYAQYTRVLIRDNDGESYYGFAKCNPEDNYSDFFGYELAENRAYIKLLKAHIKEERKRYKVIEDFVKALRCYKEFNSENDLEKKIFRQLKIQKRKLISLKEELHQAEWCEKVNLKSRMKVERKLRNKEEDEKN